MSYNNRWYGPHHHHWNGKSTRNVFRVFLGIVLVLGFLCSSCSCWISEYVLRDWYKWMRGKAKARVRWAVKFQSEEGWIAMWRARMSWKNLQWLTEPLWIRRIWSTNDSNCLDGLGAGFVWFGVFFCLMIENKSVFPTIPLSKIDDFLSLSIINFNLSSPQFMCLFWSFLFSLRKVGYLRLELY